MTSKSYQFKQNVEKIVDGVVKPRPSTAIVHSLDGNKANIRIGNSSALIRSVAIIGDPGLISINSEVQIAWNNKERPVILAGGAGEVVAPVNPRVVADGETIENSNAGLRVKKHGINYEHLNFAPALQGHTHEDLFTKGGWRVTDQGVIFNGKTFISPDGTITLGETPESVRLSCIDEEYRLWIGASEPGDATFRVDKLGQVTATAGLIAGWSLQETAIVADNSLAEINSDTPHIQLGGSSYANGGGFWVGKDSDVYKLKIGDTEKFLDWDGSDLNIQADLRSANFVQGYSGWQITQDGLAEFQDVIIRGAMQSMALERGKILATGGNVVLSKSSGIVRDNFVATTAAFDVNMKIPGDIDHSDIGNFWEVDDIVRVKNGYTEFWGAITAAVDNTDYWTLTVSKLDPAGDVFVYTGEALVNYGPSGAGVIELMSEYPLIRLFSHAGSPHSVVDNLLMIGNLDGYFGLTGKFGFGAGDTTMTGDYFYVTDEELKLSGEIYVRSGGLNIIDDDHGIEILASPTADRQLTLPDKSGTLATLDDIVGGGSGGGSAMQTDQSGGTSDTYGVLAGMIDGSNTTFTTSVPYMTGTLQVYLNGQLQTQGSSEDWAETTPGSGTFDFAVAPESGDEITVYYAMGVAAEGVVANLDDAEDGDIIVYDSGVLVSMAPIDLISEALGNNTFGINIVGNNPASDTYYKLCTLPASNLGTYDHVRIDGVLGYWAGVDKVWFSAMFCNRNGFVYKLLAVGARSDLGARLVAYQESGGATNIYVKIPSGTYTTFSANLQAMQAILFSDPPSQTITPSGTLAFDIYTATVSSIGLT
jgi:hypothetical protein